MSLEEKEKNAATLKICENWGGNRKKQPKIRDFTETIEKKILGHPHLKPKPAKNHSKDTNLDIFNK